MKKQISIGVIISSALVSLFFTGLQGSIEIGTTIPKADFKMKDAMSGGEISFSDVKKPNGLLVVFSCNTCPVVVKHEAAILETSRLARVSNIGVILVNSNEAKRVDEDSFDAMKAYGKKQGFISSYVVDPKSAVADAFGATRTPEAFLFDKDLKLVYKGAFTDNTDPSKAGIYYLNDAIKNLKDGKAITVNSTKSIGCTIKRIVPPAPATN